MSATFLQAEWRKLMMANYAVDETLLRNYLPPETEIDLWNNKCYISLVGFIFLNTKLKGFKIPFHINFEEVNLRFYVRYFDKGVWKRGVVFIKEIVPKPALTFIANTIYKENYETMPMRHSFGLEQDALRVAYSWKKGRWHNISIVTEPVPSAIIPGSKEEFITEHYWGYTKVSDNKTSEYQVLHPRWDVYRTKDFSIDVDFGAVYGQQFGFLTQAEPESVFLAEGSEISVMPARICL